MLAQLTAVLAAADVDLSRVWIVGGAVRDGLLGRAVHDLDLTAAGDSLSLARLIADQLDGAFFPLDAIRGCGRAVLRGASGERFEVDVTDLRAPSLEQDLAARDFAINAMAVPLADLGQLLDPLGGRDDLARRQVRSPNAGVLLADPLRGVRGVRLAAQLDFTIEPSTREWIRSAAPDLAAVAAERVGAELWKCFAAPRTAAALAELWELDLLGRMVPEVAATRGLGSGPPPRPDVWQHTLAVVTAVERVRELIERPVPLAALADPFEAVLVAGLKPWCDRLQQRLKRQRAVDRPTGPLLEIAAMFHDLGKPLTAPPATGLHAAGEKAFAGHPEIGASLAQSRLGVLRFARDEADWVASLVRHHGLPRQLAGPLPLDRLTIHRYHRTTGEPGIEIALLALADNLAKRGVELVERELAEWRQLVARSAELIGSALDAADSVVSPRALLSGRDILALGFAPGPAVGAAMIALVEAQVAGEVSTREQAVILVRRFMATSTISRPSTPGPGPTLGSRESATR